MLCLDHINVIIPISQIRKQAQREREVEGFAPCHRAFLRAGVQLQAFMGAGNKPALGAEEITVRLSAGGEVSDF